eukprot:Lithocolla_globosa_v1_NODE_3_length_14236_cov_22.745998.p6 type:complete len:256 gc:universal NODE_3_length_14236_cov_22.745998:4909-4142(-)
MTPCACVTITFFKQNQYYTTKHCMEAELEDNLMWITQYENVVRPCLRMDPSDPLNPGLAVDNVAEMLRALYAWFNLVRWTIYALPQVYRAALLGNFSTLITKLNEWIALLTSYRPSGYNQGPLPAGLLYPTPLSIGLTMAQLSRAIFSSVVLPSDDCSICPLPFLDFTSSLPKPNSVCAFEQMLPNYLGLIGSKVTEFAQAFTPCEEPEPPVNFNDLANDLRNAGQEMFKAALSGGDKKRSRGADDEAPNKKQKA